MHMVWVILFIPLAVWLSADLAPHFTPVSLAIVFGVILIFCIVELSQISKDHSRSKAPLLVMCLILASLLGSMMFR
jgi:glycerol uptake facilitator-like aquaporin